MIQTRTPKSKNGLLILFFCRKDCIHSNASIQLMLDLGFEVKIVYSKTMKEDLPKDVFWIDCDYIISFRSWYILPKRLIDKAKRYAINFHPGPPKYPGSGCVNFSLLNGEENYGITTHLMNEKVDNGRIINYELFPIASHLTLNNILKITHQKLYNKLTDLLLNLSLNNDEYIKSEIEKNKNVKWSNTKRTLKELNEYREIKFDFTEVEFNNRIRAFHHSEYPVFIKFFNRTFILAD